MFPHLYLLNGKVEKSEAALRARSSDSQSNSVRRRPKARDRDPAGNRDDVRRHRIPRQSAYGAQCCLYLRRARFREAGGRVSQLPELGFIACNFRPKLVKLSWRTRRPPRQWRGRRPVLCWPLSPGQQKTGKPASRQSRTVSGPSSHLFYRDHVKFHFAIAPLTSPFTARRTALTRPL
jgi:hypothetical protein